MESLKYNYLELENKGSFKIFIYLFCLLSSIYLGSKNFLIYHIFVELSSVVISFIIFAISVNAYNIHKDKTSILLGISFGFVACFDLMHMFTYEGMGIFSDNTGNIPIQLWIWARFLGSISIFISFISNKKFNLYSIFALYLTISISILVSIFYLDIFPDCYICDKGLTTFKIISEYMICLILFANIIIFIKKKHNNLNKADIAIVYSLINMIISQLIFASHICIYDIVNVIGHFFKLSSFYFLYIGLVHSSLSEPHINLIELNNTLDEKNQNLKNLIHCLAVECDKRQKLEAENTRKNEILTSILEASIDGILVIDNHGHIVHANNLLMEMWDISIELLFSRNCGMLISSMKSKLKDPNQLDTLIDEIQNNEKCYHFNIYLNNGQILETSLLPFVDKGISIGKVVRFRDITEKNKIIQLQRQIEINKISLEKAKELDEMKTNFLSIISHEFKTPLNIILGSIELLPKLCNKNNKTMNDLSINKYIQMMRQNCYRLIKLSNNIIDITKFDSGNMKLNLKNHNIVSIIEDITLSVVDYSNSKNISLIFDTTIEEQIMACDMEQLERVMLNLLSNAIKFVEPGGKIKVSLSKKDDFINISVKDNGIGIPKEMKDIIFHRFKQVNNTLRRPKEGIGIGLSIVKSIVEAHEGDILLNSEIGEGSEFIISLPIRFVEENSTSHLYYIDNQIDADKISMEFSDIYELDFIK